MASLRSLATFYFIYFAFIGALAPYFPLFLHDRGFTAYDVGSLMAMLMATRMLAPNFWGWLSDHTGQRLLLIRLGSVMAALFFALLLLTQTFWGFAFLLVTFSAFWNAVLPQFEVVTLLALKGERGRYSQIRLWGSIGFLVTVNCLGVLFELISIAWLGIILATLLCLIALNTLFIPNHYAPTRRADFRGFVDKVRQPDIWRFFLMVMLLQLSFGPYYTFFSIYLESLGYSRISIGLLWSIGVLAEIIMFTRMHLLLFRFSLRCLFMFALVLTSLRWLGVSCFASSLTALLLLQCLHAASFGMVHASSIEFVHRVFRDGHGGQGQALYGAASFGLGGGLGAWLSGLLYSQAGPSTAFAAGSVAALLALLVVLPSTTALSAFWQDKSKDAV